MCDAGLEYNEAMKAGCIGPKAYLWLALLGSALFFGPPAPLAVVTAAGDDAPARTLKFYHTHTGKRLEATFARGNTYDLETLAQVNAFLADFRNGEETVMDPALLDWLYDLQRDLGSEGTYEVISAYRSPATNEMLRSRSNGVASRSQHLLGKAIDVRLDDASVSDLHKAALRMQRGGVGFYPGSRFVHLDTGRVRRW